jgi:hypothetical protein
VTKPAESLIKNQKLKKMSMPLKKRPFRGPRTLTARVNTLSKAVAQNKNERQHFLKDTTITLPASAGVFNVQNISCITDQFTDPNFPFTVSGDKWNLHGLRLQGLSDRTIVYYPKKAGERFVPSTYNEIPDPKRFTVLMDTTQVRVVAPNAGSGSGQAVISDYRAARTLPLSRGVLIDRNGGGAGSTTERGDLVICHMNNPQKGFTVAETKSVSYMLTFSDK